MPLDLCHPTTPHEKLRLPNWFVSNLMLDRALDAIIRRARKIDRRHDIPYLAGYSRDGKTIYIDRHMPAAFDYHGRSIDTDRFLILHEEVEKTLIDQLGLHYMHAHQIALRAEQAAVRAAGIKWRDYDHFMQRYIKRLGDERLTKVPKDLDTTPYRDEHDVDLLQRMLACARRGEIPEGRDPAEFRKAVTGVRDVVAARLAHAQAHGNTVAAAPAAPAVRKRSRPPAAAAAPGTARRRRSPAAAG